MSYEYMSTDGAVTGVVFSEDHQFRSFIWLVRDAASCSIADSFDRERMFGVKLNMGDYARARVMAAVHMFPRRHAEKFDHFDRMLYWNDSTLETSKTIGDILDVHCEVLLHDIQPDMKKWKALFAQYGREAFADMTALRVNFPIYSRKKVCVLQALSENERRVFKNRNERGDVVAVDIPIARVDSM